MSFVSTYPFDWHSFDLTLVCKEHTNTCCSIYYNNTYILSIHIPLPHTAPPPPKKKNKDIRIYKDNKSNTHTHTQTPFFLDGTLNCYHPSTLASQTKRTPPKSNGRQPSVGGTVEVPISEYHPWTPRGCHLRYLLNLLKIFQITFKLVKHQQTLTTHQTLKHWLRSNYSDCSSHWFLPVTADIEDGGMGSPPIERW